MKKMTSRAALIFVCIITLCQSVSAQRLLVPGGQVIGLELADNTVTVAAFDEALGSQAKAGGLEVGDKILRIDRQAVRSAQDVRQALQQSDGSVDVSVLRGGKEKQLQLTPQITAQGPRLGVYLKQGVTGIGTVTWFDPDSGKFGALGHGVNAPGGQLIQMESGNIYESAVLSVRKGKVGDPGQLLGTLCGAEPIGSLEKNTVQGVFGTARARWQGQPLPVAEGKQVRTGSATIRSTVQGSAVQEYSVEILKIYPNSSDSGRTMLLKVTDPQLLSTTGGIVQGMGVSYNKDNQWNP